MVRNPITGRLLVDALLLQVLLLVLVICFLPFSVALASSEDHDASHSSAAGQTRMRALRRGSGGISFASDDRHLDNKNPITTTYNQEKIFQTKGDDEKDITQRFLSTTKSSFFHWRARVSAVVTTDKTQYYEGEWINVTYTMSQHDKISQFVYFARFPLKARYYDVLSNPGVKVCWNEGNSGTIALSSLEVPALNSKYKAVMAMVNPKPMLYSKPMRILGVSNAFDVLPISATLTTGKKYYYEGELMNVTYTLSQDKVNMEGGFARIALFPYNVTDYSDPACPLNLAGFGMVGNSETITVGNSETITFPFAGLRANSKYKAVMATSFYMPCRIVGVSDSFDVLPISAALTTDKTQYYEGERINVNYTMSEDSVHMVKNFALTALFAYDDSNYCPRDESYDEQQYAGNGMVGNSGTVVLSTKKLPTLSSKYKAVMLKSCQILGVSNFFYVLPNSAYLTTDKIQYYDGEWIDLIYTMTHHSDNMEGISASIAFVTYNVSDYSASFDVHYAGYWTVGNSGTIHLSSRKLPVVNSKYRVVMAVRDSTPLRILGVSNTFDVQPNSADLVTDKTHYRDGEPIDVTYIMSQYSDNMESYSALIGLFPCNVNDYKDTDWRWQRVTSNTSTISVSTPNLPGIVSKYKAVMAVDDSQPLRILGVSNCFEFLPNPAPLATEKLHFKEAKSIDGTPWLWIVDVLRVCAIAFIVFIYAFVATKKKKEN